LRLLLDTHIYLGWRSGDRRVGRRVLAAIDDATENHVSVASLWELAIQATLGRRGSIAPLVEDIAESGFRLLPVEPRHIMVVENLPLVHRDPFDRMLIAQAIVEELTLVSLDEWFPRYPVNLLRG
jgi:PIN domain nuclease of toxin-antitoxin system